MIPKGAEGVKMLAGHVIAGLVTKAPDLYTAADINFTAVLVDMAAQDFERAADMLTRDLADMKSIFRTAAPMIADPALAARVTQARALEPDSLKVSDLNAVNDAALKVLIDLHAAVEDAAAAGQAWAVELDRGVWAFYDAYAARRAYQAAF